MVKHWFKFRIDLFNCQLVFMITSDCGTTYRDMLQKYKCESDPQWKEFSGCCGMYFKACKINFILIDEQKVNFNTICHEIYHAAVGITAWRHITDEETTAWVVGYISGQIFKFINSKSIDIK